ncbi:hypothetical protein ACFL7M_18030 [Thermodesulfobacteriota bacterium]
MESKKTTGKEDKDCCADFGASFQGFQGMFRKENKCCSAMGDSADWSNIMKRMMKNFCGNKTEDLKADSNES